MLILYFLLLKGATKTQNKLADKLLDLFGEGWGIDPSELRINKGSNKFDDSCCWDGWIESPTCKKLHIHSFVSMSKLIRKKELFIVGSKIDFHNGVEIC